jgi:hypothetical protein
MRLTHTNQWIAMPVLRNPAGEKHHQREHRENRHRYPSIKTACLGVGSTERINCRYECKQQKGYRPGKSTGAQSARVTRAFGSRNFVMKMRMHDRAGLVSV